MSDDEAPNPAVIRVVRQDDPVSAVTDHDAATRMQAYPVVRIGAPLFGHAVDLDGRRWQVHALFDDTPQDARTTLAHRLRERLLDTHRPSPGRPADRRRPNPRP
ncbi:hypothetical protein Vqi01_58910 [Micromonospora qiuiae]|uniref:Uncharacterized protein n=1 Tax=Micromonospora qiuiae TaxID=502268 RepID=A0ABQ4JM96_9ACTN|nr:hypothetical protein Vqi01_58910 [Micromonospora qiuiae]